MNTKSTTMREIRSPISGALQYRVQDQSHTASWVNVSRVGACIALDRAIPPGEILEISFASPLQAGTQAQISGSVVWCARTETQNPSGWRLGIRLIRHDPEAALAFAALVYLARRKQQAEAPTTPQTWTQFQAVNPNQRGIGKMQDSGAVQQS